MSFQFVSDLVFINQNSKQTQNMKTVQPLLDIEDSPNRFAIEPVLNHDIWDMYKKEAVPSTWFAEEISLVNDLVEWNDTKKINDNERHFIEMVLAFFAGADKLVADNININFLKDVRVLEAEHFYDHQCFMERIHSEVYANLLTTYVKDPVKRDLLTNSLTTIPVIKQKGAWAQRYADSNTSSFAERLIAFTIFEGVFFSGSFCAIFYFKKRGLLEGLCLSNDFISRDEALHCRFSCLLYSHIIHRLPESKVHSMFREAVEIESAFVCEALKVALIGINSESMTQYIQYIADFWLNYLGYNTLYKTKNPFDWMHLISMDSKTNFFERRRADYSMAGVGNEESENMYGSDDDF